jgi:hypothetical protein
MEMLLDILDKPNRDFHRPSVFQFLTEKSDDRQLSVINISAIE